MQVTNPMALSNPASKPSADAASAANTVNYNQFLQLLIAQLQNQDPTNPTDSTEFVSQLASFSAVEQQVQTNAKLDTLLTDAALTKASSVIGRTITSADGAVSGQVLAVELKSGSAVALLDTGATIPLGPGIILS